MTNKLIIGLFGFEELNLLLRQKHRSDTDENIVHNTIHNLAHDIVRDEYCQLFNCISAPKYCYNQMGKPYYENCDFEFSLSHSHDKTFNQWAISVSLSKNTTGSDVQWHRKLTNSYQSILRKIALPDELNFFQTEILKSSCNMDMLQNFYDLWVLKESFCKMTGIGLSDSKNILFDLKKSAIVNNPPFATQILDTHTDKNELKWASVPFIPKNQKYNSCKFYLLTSKKTPNVSLAICFNPSEKPM